MTLADVQAGDVVRLADDSVWLIGWRCRGRGVFARRFSAEAWQAVGQHWVYHDDHREVVKRAVGGKKPRARKEAA